MRRILAIALFVQLSSGGLWTLAVAGTPGRGDFGLLGLFVIVYALQAVAVMPALWALWRHPAERRRAAWMLAMPVVFWFAPGIVKSLAGGHLSSEEMIVVLAAAAAIVLVACFVVPRRVAAFVPGFLVTSPVFNSLLLAGVIVGWLFLIGMAVLVFGGGAPASSDATGYGLAYAIVLASLSLIGFGAASLVAAAWAWIGLRSGLDGACRKLNVAQLVVSMPGLLIGAGAVMFLANQG